MYRMLVVFGVIFSLIVISFGDIGGGNGGSIDYGNISNVENSVEHDDHHEALNGILEENNYIPTINGIGR